MQTLCQDRCFRRQSQLMPVCRDHENAGKGQDGSQTPLVVSAKAARVTALVANSSCGAHSHSPRRAIDIQKENTCSREAAESEDTTCLFRQPLPLLIWLGKFGKGLTAR